MGFVNVLNSNTLGHLSLGPKPDSVNHQTSYFLRWFGSKVAQERAEREAGDRTAGDGVELSGEGRVCGGGGVLLFNEILM